MIWRIGVGGWMCVCFPPSDWPITSTSRGVRTLRIRIWPSTRCSPGWDGSSCALCACLPGEWLVHQPERGEGSLAIHSRYSSSSNHQLPFLPQLYAVQTLKTRELHSPTGIEPNGLRLGILLLNHNLLNSNTLLNQWTNEPVNYWTKWTGNTTGNEASQLRSTHPALNLSRNFYPGSVFSDGIYKLFAQYRMKNSTMPYSVRIADFILYSIAMRNKGTAEINAMLL